MKNAEPPEHLYVGKSVTTLAKSVGHFAAPTLLASVATGFAYANSSGITCPSRTIMIGRPVSVWYSF